MATLRDLKYKVEAIARAGKHQHLIIESTGISDPTPVAEALATSDSSTDIYADDSSTEGNACDSWTAFTSGPVCSSHFRSGAQQEIDVLSMSD